MPNDNFRKWFGDYDDPNMWTSKYTGDNLSSSVTRGREPLIVYHGTNEAFRKFELGRSTYNNYGFFGNVETKRWAIFTTHDVKFAETYLSDNGGSIMPLYCNMKYPLDLTRYDLYDVGDELSEFGLNPRWLARLDHIWEAFDDDDGKLFVEICKKAGYDGVIFEEENQRTGESVEVHAVFSPNQLKSAIGNRGTYDPQSDYIDESTKRFLEMKEMDLAKWNEYQKNLWLQLVKDGYVEKNNMDKFFDFAKYFFHFFKNTGKIMSYSLLINYIQGNIGND